MITKAELRRLRRETTGHNEGNFEPAYIDRKTLAILLDAIEALDEIQANAYRVIGPGIDVPHA